MGSLEFLGHILNFLWHKYTLLVLVMLCYCPFILNTYQIFTFGTNLIRYNLSYVFYFVQFGLYGIWNFILLKIIIKQQCHFFHLFLWLYVQIKSFNKPKQKKVRNHWFVFNGIFRQMQQIKANLQIEMTADF